MLFSQPRGLLFHRCKNKSCNTCDENRGGRACGQTQNPESSGSVLLAEIPPASWSCTALLSHTLPLLVTAFQMALYFCTGILKDETLFRHYALNVPFYTHFTSPIRRYADVVVHRLLSASLGGCRESHAGGASGFLP